MINRKLIIKKFGSFGRFFLHTKNQDLYIFDDSSNDDFVIKTKLNLLTKEHTLYDDVSGSENSKRVNDLVKSLISQTSSSVIEEFNLSSTQIQALKDTLNLIQGTHLRFFSNDNKLNVTVFINVG